MSRGSDGLPAERTCRSQACQAAVATPRSLYCTPCAKARLRRQNREAQRVWRARTRGEYLRPGHYYISRAVDLRRKVDEAQKALESGELTILGIKRLIAAADEAAKAMERDIARDETRRRLPKTGRS